MKRLPEACVRTIGKCIYCGATDGLTKEHIVPYALEGNAYLKDASCPKCQVITSKIERAVLANGGQLYPLRRALGLRSRRPKADRYKTKIVKKDGAETDLTIDFDKAPVAVPIRRFTGRPGIVIGKGVRGPYEKAGWDLFSPANNALRRANLDISAIEYNLSTSNNYEKMMLKIAHCAAVATFGLDALDPLVLDAILGDPDGLQTPYLLGEAPSGTYDPFTSKTFGYAQHPRSDGSYLLSVLYRPWIGRECPAYEMAVALMDKRFDELEYLDW